MTHQYHTADQINRNQFRLDESRPLAWHTALFRTSIMHDQATFPDNCRNHSGGKCLGATNARVPNHGHNLCQTDDGSERASECAVDI